MRIVAFLTNLGFRLCSAADCYHAGTLANAISVSALAALTSGDLIYAVWLLGYSAVFVAMMLIAVEQVRTYPSLPESEASQTPIAPKPLPRKMPKKKIAKAKTRGKPMKRARPSRKGAA